MIAENEFNALPLYEARLRLLNYRDYLSRFPGIKYGSGHFNRVSKYLDRYDFCHSMKRSTYSVFRELSKKISRKAKFEVGDVVLIDGSGVFTLAIIIHKQISWFFTPLQFAYKLSAGLEYAIEYATVGEGCLTLISKGDFKNEMK